MYVKVIVLCVYLICMLGIGIFYYRKNQNFQDYILGGRSLGKWTTALSAQASDMSGWLLLGLPGAAYLAGVEAGWIAIGLAIGTYANWKMVAKRLRIYTESTNNSLTLPDYLQNRFEDSSNFLRVIPAVVIIIFFTVYTSAQFATGAKLFNILLDIPYQTALIIGGIVIVGYTFLGGFLAVSVTDLIQGLLMFFALVIVPIVVIFEVGGFSTAINQMATIDPNYLSMFMQTGSQSGIATIAIISNLAWGLGYFGQPHILVRFMSIKSASDIKPARRIAIIWACITLVAAVGVGVLGRIYFMPELLHDSETVFMFMVDKAFPSIISGVLLSAILAASMSTADSQLLVTASSVSEDIYKKFFNKNASDKTLLRVGRISVVVVAFIALWIARDPNSSVFGLVSNAWAGLGASFGPVILMSLFWKRMNRYGAIAGILSGASCVVLWIKLREFLPDVSIFSLYEIVPAFIISVICIVIFSYVGSGPSQDMMDKYSSVQKALD